MRPACPEGAPLSPRVPGDVFVQHLDSMCGSRSVSPEHVTWSPSHGRVGGWAHVRGRTHGRTTGRYTHPKGGRPQTERGCSVASVAPGPIAQVVRRSYPSLSSASQVLTGKAGLGVGPRPRGGGWRKLELRVSGRSRVVLPGARGARSGSHRSESGVRSGTGVFPALPPAMPAPGRPHPVPGQATSSGRAPGDCGGR